MAIRMCSYLSVVLVLSVVLATTMATKEEILSATEVANGNSKFTTRLYNILAKQPGNVFFSPISAHAVLALAYQGAAGATAEAFRTSLSLPIAKTAAFGYKNIMSELNSVKNVTLNIANKVFVYEAGKLKADFKSVAVNQFYSEAESVNFVEKDKAAATINGWVEKRTNNKIKDLISPNDLDADTRLVLVNAIYFKGNWANKFNKDQTRTQKFYLNAVDAVDCQMMHMTANYDYTESAELDAKILRMPYDNKDVSMVIILPNSKDGIQALEQKLANKDLTTLTNNLRNVEVVLSLPKFKIETTIPLNDALSELGLGVIFSNGAEFPNLIEGGEPLKVSKVIQKAFIEVNEEGAEAAAATEFDIIDRIMTSEPDIFYVNHPFIFYIQQTTVAENKTLTNTPVFYGKVAKFS